MINQLNTHNPAGFYQFFPPDVAQAYLDRFVFHYTPKKGSWLNMAEIGIGVLKRQCLDRRIHHAATLRSEDAAWEVLRNAADRLIDWQLTTNDARIKLLRLYPVEIEEDQHVQVEATVSGLLKFSVIKNLTVEGLNYSNPTDLYQSIESSITVAKSLSVFPSRLSGGTAT